MSDVSPDASNASPKPMPPRAITRWFDPKTFVATFSIWGIVTGLSLLWPGAVFHINPVYHSLALTGIGEDQWGALMLTDGICLATSAAVDSGSFRFAAAIVSGVAWTYIGAELLLGAATEGFLSAGGAWSLAGGTGCFLAAYGWLLRRTTKCPN